MLESDQLIHKLVRRSKEADLLYNKYQEQVKKFDQERAIILERVKIKKFHKKVFCQTFLGSATIFRKRNLTRKFLPNFVFQKFHPNLSKFWFCQKMVVKKLVCRKLGNNLFS